MAHIAISVLLWMPFGMGYYGWPWERVSFRILIQVVAFAFVVFSGGGLLFALRADRKVFRLVTGIVALLVTAYGVFALYSWKDRYLGFLRARDRQNSVEQSAPANVASPRR